MITEFNGHDYIGGKEVWQAATCCEEKLQEGTSRKAVWLGETYICFRKFS